MVFYKFRSCGFSYPTKILHFCFQIRVDKRSSSDKNLHFHLFVFETPLVIKNVQLESGVLSKQRLIVTSHLFP